MDVPQVPRESIFRIGLKTFCRMFFGVLGICIAFTLFSLIYSSASTSPLLEEKTTMHLLADANGKRELVSSSAPVILQIPIHGVIGDPQKLDAEILENVLLDSRTGTLSGNRVKGILLHFNTPGGTVVDSDSIYEMLRTYKERYKVPIFGYVEGLCASGGMYIASAADEMFAGPASLIGSVGVILGPIFNFYEFMGKVGLQAHTLTEGIDKDMFNPTRAWREGEDASVKATIAFSYHRFVDVVTSARTRLNKTKLVEEYGAQVYDCVTAEQLGYIDHAMTTRDDALRALLAAANIGTETPYQVVSLSPKHPWLSELVSGKSPLLSGKIEHTVAGMPDKLREMPCYLYSNSHSK